MAGEVSFFELGVEDPSKGRAFYEGLFGWEFEPGPSGGGGHTVRTPGVPGGMHGGDPRGGPYVFFAVDDMEAALEKVRELGGEVEPVEMNGNKEAAARLGRFKLCRCNQGSAFGLHEPPRGQ